MHSNFIIAESSANSRSHEGDNDDCCLLGHDAVYPSTSVQMLYPSTSLQMLYPSTSVQMFQRRSFLLYQQGI